MSDYDPAETADVLRAAHDEMLIRGRATGQAVNDAGEVCLYAAIGAGAKKILVRDELTGPACARAVKVMLARGFTTDWNDEVATTDDVLDAFLNTEKQLREDAS